MNKLYIPNGSGEQTAPISPFVLRTKSCHPEHLPEFPPTTWVAFPQLPMRPPARHVTSHPASSSDRSALGRGPPSRASLATTRSHLAVLPPPLTPPSVGLRALAPVSPHSCPRPTAGLLLTGRALPTSSYQQHECP